MSARLVPVVVKCTLSGFSAWEQGKKLQADLDSASIMTQQDGEQVSVTTYVTVDGQLCTYGTINLRWLEPEPGDAATAAQLAELYLQADQLPDFRMVR